MTGLESYEETRRKLLSLEIGERFAQIFESKRLFNDIRHTQAFSFRYLRGGGASGDNDDRKSLMRLTNSLKDVEAAETGHNQIQKDGIWGKCPKNSERLLSIPGDYGFMPLDPDRLGNNFSNFWFVVHHQDLHHEDSPKNIDLKKRWPLGSRNSCIIRARSQAVK